jgi:hypothetical protein
LHASIPHARSLRLARERGRIPGHSEPALGDLEAGHRRRTGCSGDDVRTDDENGHAVIVHGVRCITVSYCATRETDDPELSWIEVFAGMTTSKVLVHVR